MIVNSFNQYCIITYRPRKEDNSQWEDDVVIKPAINSKIKLIGPSSYTAYTAAKPTKTFVIYWILRCHKAYFSKYISRMPLHFHSWWYQPSSLKLCWFPYRPDVSRSVLYGDTDPLFPACIKYVTGSALQNC